MADPDTHYMLLYEYVDDIVERRGPYREAHLAKIRAEREAGRLVMAGALGDPPHGGALVFRGINADEVEAFAQTDPYVEAGLVRGRRIDLWKLV
jgi:uncharacterized protein YciI